MSRPQWEKFVGPRAEALDSLSRSSTLSDDVILPALHCLSEERQTCVFLRARKGGKKRARDSVCLSTRERNVLDRRRGRVRCFSLRSLSLSVAVSELWTFSNGLTPLFDETTERSGDRSSPAVLCPPRRSQRRHVQLDWLDPRSRRFAVRERHFPAEHSLSHGLSLQATSDSLLHAHLSPEHQRPRRYLSGHSPGEMVAGDESAHRSSQSLFVTHRSQSRTRTGERHSPSLSHRSTTLRAKCKGMDEKIRDEHGQRHSCQRIKLFFSCR